jgi:hypothetical protein
MRTADGQRSNSDRTTVYFDGYNDEGAYVAEYKLLLASGRCSCARKSFPVKDHGGFEQAKSAAQETLKDMHDSHKMVQDWCMPGRGVDRVIDHIERQRLLDELPPGGVDVARIGQGRDLD